MGEGFYFLYQFLLNLQAEGVGDVCHLACAVPGKTAANKFLGLASCHCEEVKYQVHTVPCVEAFGEPHVIFAAVVQLIHILGVSLKEVQIIAVGSLHVLLYAAVNRFNSAGDFLFHCLYCGDFLAVGCLIFHISLMLCRRFFVNLAAVNFLTRCKVSMRISYYQIF